MTDRVTAEFNRRCREGDRELALCMEKAALPSALMASMRDRFLPRPFFVSREQIVGFSERVVALFDLLLSVPDRFYGGDLERYAAAVGMDARRAAFLAQFTGRPELYGRADLYHDGDSLRLLEFNVGSALGGMDRAQISAALLEVEPFRAFATEHGLDFVDTGARVDAALRAAARPVCGERAPVVAFVDGNGAMAPYLHLALSFREMMARFGVDVVLGELANVGFSDKRVTLHGRPVDVVLRYFGVGDFLDDPAGLMVVEDLVRADANGEVVLYTSLAGELYNNKTSLALLTDLAARGALTGAESALVDQVLPWTRTMTEDLVELCRERRAELILKPGADFGGAGIVAGWLVDEAEWDRATAAAVEHGSIVQERVVPRAEPVLDPATGEMSEWNAVWDCFLTPEGYAGSHIRALPAGGGAVIGMGVTAAARTTGIFRFPE